MTSQVWTAFLRAVNVGGTNKLSMQVLREHCLELGFGEVSSYIASGNLVFASSLEGPVVQKLLEERLCSLLGKPVGVVVLSLAELESALQRCPFQDREGNKVATFLSQQPQALGEVLGRKD